MELRGNIIPNHGLVSVSNIGDTVATSLRCVTQRMDCCSRVSEIVSRWLDPRGLDAKNLGSFMCSKSGENEPLGYVNLLTTSTPLQPSHQGIYYCIIPKFEPASIIDIHTQYVGIYLDGNGKITLVKVKYM